MTADTVRITVRIPREIHDEMVRLSKEAERSLNWQMVRSMKLGAARQQLEAGLHPQERLEMNA